MQESLWQSLPPSETLPAGTEAPSQWVLLSLTGLFAQLTKPDFDHLALKSLKATLRNIYKSIIAISIYNEYISYKKNKITIRFYLIPSAHIVRMVSKT